MTDRYKELSASLSPEEIETSIDMSDELMAVFDYINAMQYLSEVRKFWHSLTRLTINSKFSPEEVDVIAVALKRREFEISAKSIGYGAIKSPSDDWTPSRVLENMDTTTREPDWRERQLPPTDRE